MEMLKSVKALQDFLEQTPSIWNEQNDQPAPNSRAARELAEYERPKSILTAYSQANFLFEAAADYSWAVVKTLTEPITSIACWACARGVLATSALATWLWDEKINVNQREERSLTLRYEGLIQQNKFAKASKGEINPDIVMKRLKEIEEIALNLGFAKLVIKNGTNKILFTHPMPSETKVITDMLDKQLDYRLFSAMVHGHVWAIQPLSFGKDAEQQEEIDLMGGKYVEKYIDIKVVEGLCRQTLNCLSVPILMRFKLFGWNSTLMELAINQAIMEIAVS